MIGIRVICVLLTVKFVASLPATKSTSYGRLTQDNRREGRYFVVPVASNSPANQPLNQPSFLDTAVQGKSSASSLNNQARYSPETIVLIPENNQDLMTLQQLSRPGAGYVMPIASGPWTPNHAWSSGNEGESIAGRSKFLFGADGTLSADSSYQARDSAGYDSIVDTIRQYFPIFAIDPAINGVSFLKPAAPQVLVAATAKADIRDGADVPGQNPSDVFGEAFFHQENGLKETSTLITISGLPPSRTFNVVVYDGKDLNTAACAGTGQLPYTPKGLTGVIALNIPSSGGGALTVVQRTPATVMTVAGVTTIVGKSIVILDTATGTRVACGLISLL